MVNILAIILIAFGLSMDALAVSITTGVMIKKTKIKSALKVGIYFGVFQALMPLAGWVLGIQLSQYIAKIDHWIALIILSFIGGRMIYESIKEKNTECKEYMQNDKKDPLSNRTLFILAIATSIDALAAGISFAFLNVSITKTVIIIGGITFVLCFIGVLVGKICGELLKSHAKIFGGIILVAIGVKIFIEHTNIGSIIRFLQ
jgi:manganese efflux pump family protein